MKQRKSFLLRMDPALYAALEAWAQQELRSLNGQIEYVLKEAVAKQRQGIIRGKSGEQVSGPSDPDEFSKKPPPHG
jgi:hypothetical protein